MKSSGEVPLHPSGLNAEPFAAVARAVAAALLSSVCRPIQLTFLLALLLLLLLLLLFLPLRAMTVVHLIPFGFLAMSTTHLLLFLFIWLLLLLFATFSSCSKRGALPHHHAACAKCCIL